MNTLTKLQKRQKQLNSLIAKFAGVKSLVRKWVFELTIIEGQIEMEEATVSVKSSQTVEPKEEGKKLHVAIFYQEKAKPKKEEWNYRNVVRVIGNHAKDHNEPMAVKYYGAALFLAHLMDTGRLTGTKVFFKIWKLSTREVCNLIIEIHNQMTKTGHVDEYGIIEWLSKKARKSPYDIAA